MTTKINDTINDSMDSAKNLMSSAKQETEHAVATTRSVVLDGVRAVASVVSILRGFGVGDALGWFGLARRNRMSSLATFGAGVAVGAGVGMLLAPVSGSDARRAIMKSVRGLMGDAGRTVEKAEASVENAGKQAIAKVGDFAAKTKVAVVHAEHELEEALTQRLDTTKESARATGATEPARATGATEPGNHRPVQPVR